MNDLEPRIRGYAQSHHARESDLPFRKRTRLRAIHSLPVMPALEKRIRKEASDAKRDPSMLASFRTLRLNMGTDGVLESPCWMLGRGRGLQAMRPAKSDMFSASTLASPKRCPQRRYTGRQAGALKHSQVSRPYRVSQRRSQNGVGGLYQHMAMRAELVTTGGEAVHIGEFLELVRERFGLPSAIAADR